VTGDVPGRRRGGDRVPAWVTRVWEGPVTGLRAQYTFALARLCACPPPVALAMGLLDFGRLIDAVDRYNAAMQQPDRG